MNFPQFKNKVFPRIKEYDQSLIEQLKQWDDTIKKEPEAKEKKSRKNKKKTTTDLLLSKSSGSPFPVYKILQQAESYTEQEIIDAFHHLHNADVKLKSTGQNAKLVLESVLFNICETPNPN